MISRRLKCTWNKELICEYNRMCSGCENQPKNEDKINGKNPPVKMINYGLCPACGEITYGDEVCTFCGQRFLPSVATQRVEQSDNLEEKCPICNTFPKFSNHEDGIDYYAENYSCSCGYIKAKLKDYEKELYSEDENDKREENNDSSYEYDNALEIGKRWIKERIISLVNDDIEYANELIKSNSSLFNVEFSISITSDKLLCKESMNIVDACKLAYDYYKINNDIYSALLSIDMPIISYNMCGGVINVEWQTYGFMYDPSLKDYIPKHNVGDIVVYGNGVCIVNSVVNTYDDPSVLLCKNPNIGDFNKYYEMCGITDDLYIKYIWLDDHITDYKLNNDESTYSEETKLLKSWMESLDYFDDMKYNNDRLILIKDFINSIK